MPGQNRLVDAVLCCPVLSKDFLAFSLGHLDQMLPTATATIVAVPILQDRKFQTRFRHSFLSSVETFHSRPVTTFPQAAGDKDAELLFADLKDAANLTPLRA